MKLFYRKDYKRVSGELEIAKIELNRAYFKLETCKNNINRLENEIKSVNASKGGLTKEINKLKCELIEKDNLIDEKQKMIDEQIPTDYEKYNSYIEFSNSAYDSVYEKFEELEKGSE